MYKTCLFLYVCFGDTICKRLHAHMLSQSHMDGRTSKDRIFGLTAKYLNQVKKPSFALPSVFG